MSDNKYHKKFDPWEVEKEVPITEQTPTDQWAIEKEVPIVPEGGYKTRTPEELIQAQTGLGPPTPYPWLNAVIGVPRAIGGILGSAYNVGKDAVMPPDPNNQGEMAASLLGPIALAEYRANVNEAGQTADALKRAHDISQMKPGTYPIPNSLMAAGTAAQALPIVGPLGRQLGERAAAGDIPGAVSEGVTSAFMLGSPTFNEGLYKSTIGPFGKAYRWWRPKSDPNIVSPIDTSAEKMMSAVVPNSKYAPDFSDNMIYELGNLRDFIKRTNNPMNTAAEFEQALEGAGKEQLEHLHKIEGPYENDVLDVTGGIGRDPAKRALTGQEVPHYGGETKADETSRPIGASPNSLPIVNRTATIKQISNRISEINNLLNPAYAKLHEAEVNSKLALPKNQNLLAENRFLTDLLENELSKRTGIPADQIQRLRWDVGKLYALETTVKAARQGKLIEEGVAKGAGPPFFHSPIGAISEGYKTLKGGRVAISDRAIAKAWKELSEYDIQPHEPPKTPEGYKPTRDWLSQKQREVYQNEVAHQENAKETQRKLEAQKSKTAEYLREGNKEKARQSAQQEHLYEQELQERAQASAADRGRLAQFLRDTKTKELNDFVTAQRQHIAGQGIESDWEAIQRQMMNPPKREPTATETIAQTKAIEEGKKSAEARKTAAKEKRAETKQKDIAKQAYEKQKQSLGAENLNQAVRNAVEERAKQAETARAKNRIPEPPKPKTETKAEPKKGKVTKAKLAPPPEKVTPQTHHFSKASWKAANPEGDLDAAVKAAQDAGYDIVE